MPPSDTEIYPEAPYETDYSVYCQFLQVVFLIFYLFFTNTLEIINIHPFYKIFLNCFSALLT